MPFDRWRPAATLDGVTAGLSEPCPVCNGHVPYGLGVVRLWHRLHFWCAVGDISAGASTETRLASGATV